MNRRVIVELVKAGNKICLGDRLLKLDELTMNASLKHEALVQ
jgi:hypothetical protein